MKTKVLLIITAFVVSTSMFAQRSVRIGYVDMEYILENVEEYREANEQLANKVEKWKLEIEGEQNEIDKMRQSLLAEKVLLTNELIAEREEEIAILEKEMLQYQQDRFGPQGDLVIQKLRLVQPIQDQVFNEVQQIGKNKNYDFIFDKSADVVMLYAEKRNDISELVLRAISRTRKISAPKKSSTRNRFDDDVEETEKPITEALLERQEKAKEAEAARAKTAEEKRAEQLKLREERKKAYEARRKKLLEEREAKKKENTEENGNE
ncbi:OmpH family outer membrane protein [Cellulophaga sp. F20128]|uniref:OmpH family outer membrane protein n=1 Tax=Cellulophaga sp. F20128 TaxID=2926413 RepID=UPI001FF43718|nr:OmpH family outer membrane protein [Cellulophaga sp. F20128]MCK0155997.1 OmpH family outer membrane protein [Cellulophaga sp. F20128]